MGPEARRVILSYLALSRAAASHRLSMAASLAIAILEKVLEPTEQTSHT